MEQQQEVAQPQALPADVESMLQPISADHTQVQPAAEPVAVVQPAPVPEARPTPTVPLPELLEQRHRAQMAEREAQYAKERLAEFQQALQAQYRASQPQPQPIDPVADPEGFARAVAQKIAQTEQSVQDQALHQRANMSEMLARRENDGALVDQAIEAAKQAGLNRNFMMQPDPYRALMDWHKSQTVAKEVGTDLNAFKAKIREEILAEMRVQRPAAAPQILPPSLSSATRASTTSPVIQDTSDFFRTQLFAKPQRT